MSMSNDVIEYSGDLFESKTDVIVNTVNCVGVMGKGIALKFKQLYPDMYARYNQLCVDGRFEIGQLWLFHPCTGQPDVLCFPTKKHWRNGSKLEWIELGLINFVETYKNRGIESITFPQLGCANGGLNYHSDVRPLMLKYLSGLDIEVRIVTYD